MKKQMIKRQKVRPGGGSKAQRLPLVLLGSFAGGIGASAALLCLFAFLMLRLPIPLTLVRPFACAAAAVGAAASGLLLAQGLGRQKMLCGLACGVFYGLCLLAATLMTGHAPDGGGAGLTVLAALVFGGLLGGAASALHCA